VARIEAALYDWDGRPLLRLSFQGDNEEGDLERLLAALDALS
jgi:hypothetical protein